MQHLWEADHPYYAAEGNYYGPAGECHTRLDSWAEFTETTFYGGDRDLNLLYRWDWNSWSRDPDPHTSNTDKLSLFFILQRKAIACSVEITVTDADEPAVRAWLETCAATVGALWEPLTVMPRS